MMNISEGYIRQCSLILGQFDSTRVNVLVTLFRHQDVCSPLIYLSNNLKEKFENLLTSKRDDDEIYNDTPLTRIELAIMIHFKQKYLSELLTDNDSNQLKSNIKFSIEGELTLAYCFLLAQIDDRLSEKFLDEVKFLFNIQQPVKSLFDVYEKLGEKFPTFFSLLIHCGYFAQYLVVADKLIRDFELFIKRYEDFIVTFEKHYKLLPDNGNNYTQTDAILNQNDTQEISSFMSELLTTNRDLIKPSICISVEQPSSRPIIQQSIPKSSDITRKALCVIINITAFISSQSIHTPKRSGSDKDVDLIKLVFRKLRFTILECKFDFKKSDLDAALDHIDNKTEFGDFDCLVMFIMSHGRLHSFSTADSKEVIIRDIVRRYADSSPTTIWNGKSRMFFIQACRSLWPEHNQSNNREEIKQTDLSPRMLVAYSCSANEVSKRSPTAGSIFIQILCIMLFRYSHCYQIQYILEWTAKFVIKFGENENERKKIQKDVQRPEYIEREFSSDFRFSDCYLHGKYQPLSKDEQLMLCIPFGIWQEIYDLIFEKIISNHK